MVPRVLPLRLAFAFCLSFLIFWTFLSYENSFALLLRWHGGKMHRYTTGRLKHANKSSYPIDAGDIGQIVKTGYATQDRLSARLETIGPEWRTGNVVFAGDYESAEGKFRLNGEEIQVQDVLLGLSNMDTEAERMAKYGDFKHAVKLEDSAVSVDILKTGWELDIMKHIPALELGYKTMPNKKWYILTDDDSYIHTPSLIAILSTLNPHKPYYLGNAIGDYKCRFAHGGSGIVFSQAAMHKIFVHNKHTVSAAKKESLTAYLGDKLIAQMAMRCGIYIKEDFRHHFNGETPWTSKIDAQRFCKEIVTFHKLSPEDIGRTAAALRRVKTAIRW